ncbi:hypothetical protein RMCBS344292_09747 [Rhizopus microsporus]|nr:hypothetical protein RMCBS344292_09747 [Rhizopus microsporus]
MSNENNEQLFTREQVEQIIEELVNKLTLERPSVGATELPKDTLEELEHSSSNTLHKGIKEFSKNILKYEDNEWAASEMFNREFHKELKRRTIDAFQSTNAVYKGADRLIIAGRAVASLFEECKQFLEQGNEETFLHIIEGVRQLAVYSLVSNKTTKTETRSMALKTLKFPDSVKHLDEEPNDKSLALDKETVKKIYQARYEQSILRNAVGRSQHSFNQRSRGYGKQQCNTRGRGAFHKSFFDKRRDL